MPVTSTFYVGPAAQLARRLGEGPGQLGPEVPSLDVGVGFRRGGLGADEIETAWRRLRALRGERGPAPALAGAEVLAGEAEEGQLLRLPPAFVADFAALTAAEATELARGLEDARLADARVSRERSLRLVSRPIQSRLDVLAFVLVPLFTWLESRDLRVTLGVTALLALVAVVVLPWWRRRKVPPASVRPVDDAPALLAVATICRTARSRGEDLVYEWSL